MKIEIICTTCKNTLPSSSFYLQRDSKSGFQSSCINCKKEYNKKMRDSEEGRAKGKIYRELNKDRKKESGILYRIENKEKLAKKAKKYALDNPEKSSIASNKHYKKNKIKLDDRTKLFRINNPERALEIARKSKTKMKDSLSDSYVKSIIVGTNKGMSRLDIPKELIELKRIIIKTERLCRQ